VIKLTIDLKILKKFRQAHPTPVNAAPRILAKYLSVLTELIEAAAHQERTAFMSKKGLYSINVSKLHQCCQFGKERTRLHKWLEDNGLSLIEIVERGNNINGLNSWVKLTELVTLEDVIAEAVTSRNLTDQEIDELLIGSADADAELLARLYPELNKNLTTEQMTKTFDIVPVDIASIENYITWLLTEADLLSEVKREQIIRQAKTILTVARQLQGKYLQRKKRSEFGRMYYEGISVQNVNKSLRRAMLGDCWEYDVRSSVVAWKMSFSKGFLQAAGYKEEVRKAFNTTLWYLEGKSEFMQHLQSYTFADESNVAVDLQTKLIKEAMTALCFGARLSMHGWCTDDVGWKNPALGSIIKNEAERRRFVSCKLVQEFVREQNVLDNYIFDMVKRDVPELLKNPLLRTNKRPSKSKIVAYVYQKTETQAMAYAYKFLASQKIKVLAKIHDAFIVRNQLLDSVKFELESYVRLETNNEYWRLGENQLHRWGEVISQEEKQRIAEHKAFIANEPEYMREKLKKRIEQGS